MNSVKTGLLLSFLFISVFCVAQKPCVFRVVGFDETKPLSEGIAPIRKGKLWGFADSVGNVLVTPQYDVVEPHKEGVALVGMFNKQRGDTLRYYDTQLDQDITEVRFPTTYEFVNKKGRVVMRLTEYDEVRSFSDSLAVVGKYIKEAGKKTMTYGFIRHGGKFRVPLQYNAVGDVSEGLFSFRKDDRTGFINLEGDTIAPPIYDVVKSFSCGFSLVLCHNGRYNYVDKKGKKLLENDVWEASEFRNNRAFVRLDNRSQWFSLINTKGEQVKLLPYKYHSNFSEGFCGVWNKATLFTFEKVATFIDLDGNKANIGDYDEVGNFTNGLAKVRMDNDIFYINHKGEEQKCLE